MSIRRPSALRPWAAVVACTILAIGAAMLSFAGSARAAGGTPVILDTDIFSSADDVGAISTAFALQAQGQADILAINLNTRTSRPEVATDSYQCVSALANYYGDPTIPIGSEYTTLGSPPANSPDFVGPCAKLAPGAAPSTVPSAVSVYENALNAAAANSVVIISHGYMGNLAALLQANPTLVASKVKMLVVMGGAYPTSTYENNLGGDIASAQYVAQNWPTQIVWDGQEIGDQVKTGQTVSAKQPQYSPLRVAYEAFAGAGNWIYSHDLTAVYYGITSTSIFGLSAAGTNAVTSGGGNTFTTGAGTQNYLTFADPTNGPTSLDTALEALLDYVPAAGSATAPTNTALPAITGTAQQGQPLTVSTGSWTGTPTMYSYQWLDCTGPTTCYTIPGAISPTYTPIANQVGDTLEAEVWASVPGASSAPATSAPTAAVLAPSSPVPVNTAAPAISGTAQVGHTLTESHGTWSNSPTGYTYQWEDCTAAGTSCTPIPGATGQTYTPNTGDVGHALVVQETASNSGGPGTAASSAPTAVVSAPAAPAVPVSTRAPAIYGNAQAGQTLTEGHGSWTGSPTGYGYQWETCDWMGNNCTPISGATGQAYALSAGDVGSTIRVLETATNAGGTGSPAVSSATGLVQAAPTSSGTTPPPSSGGRQITRASVRTALVRALAVHGRGGHIRMLRRSHAYTFVFKAPAGGRLVVAWYYKPRHHHRVLIARRRVVLHHTGRARIRLKLNRRGRRLLAHHRSLKVTAKGSFTPVGQPTISVSRSLRLRR